MKKDIKKQWVEALRSGKYKQGTGRLCDTRGKKLKFCCLGVLFDIAGGEVDGKWVRDNNKLGWLAKTPNLLFEEAELGHLPKDFREFCELEHNQISELISLNDIERVSFKEIANWIGKNL